MSETIQFDEISVGAILRNVAPARLYEEALRHERGSIISDQGALVVSSGNKTGRSPATSASSSIHEVAPTSGGAQSTSSSKSTPL